MDLKPFLSYAKDLAYQAGKISLRYFQQGISAEYKPDNSPVTIADRVVEEYIRTQLEKEYPDCAIVGEEFGTRENSSHPIRWIIDPIDGTKSFMRGIPLYAVLIGVEIEGRVKVGAAYYPALDEMLCAADGEGCWWNDRPARVSTIDRLDKAFVCYTSLRGSLNENQSRLWSIVNQKAYALRGWSDAYGYLAVATGRAEIMLDPVMKIWDCGPFPPIFRESGGFFGSWSGVEGHTHGEALACNSVLLDQLVH